MSDPDEFLETLTEELAEFYPGSRTQRRPAAPEPDEEGDDPEWAEPIYRRSYPLEAGGPEHEFWTLGALAAALNRSSVTLRLWERNGILPPPLFRTPADGAIAGKRLYTRAQIEGLQLIAQEEGLLYSQVPPTKTRFTTRAIALFQSTQQDEG